jgi:dienelactone hydrolase
MSRYFLLLTLTACASFPRQHLTGTQRLNHTGDLAAEMVNGIKEYLLRATAESHKSRRPTVERLRYITGVVDSRVPVQVTTTTVLAKTAAYSIRAATWPVLDGISAEGILIDPAEPPRGFVVAIPDADEPPERFAAAQQLAASGLTVLAPTLINRQDTYSGNPDIRMTNQPHREWLYRMSYPLGRHVIGFEVQKVLAAVDWFATKADAKPIGVWGYGEGGLIALNAAAMDTRIKTAGVSGYSGPHEDLWKQPIYRNVWGLLKDFGTVEIASLVAPRRLVFDATNEPAVTGPPPASQQRSGAAPGELRSAELRPADKQVIEGKAGSLADFIAAMNGVSKAAFRSIDVPIPDTNARQRRAIRQIETFCTRLVDRSDRERSRLWQREGAEGVRARLRTDIVGELPRDSAPVNPRTREIAPGKNWRGYEVVIDAAPGLIAYGVLLIPSDMRPGEKRPTVVMQHGLDGRPQDLFAQPSGRAFDVYQNIGDRLAEAGFVVYLPQNPYIHDFRPISRLSNPLGLTMFSFILRQHERTLQWLQSLPFVDAKRIGFYGLSYGGTTALRVPPLIDTYKVSICSGNFNEWVRKLTTTTEPYSYMFTREYEIFEYNLAHLASHAEMAMLMAPRPFMVERGHRDGVGIDEWVAYEYAKVARFYKQQGIADRAAIEYFDGPHRIDGPATIEFLKRHLAKE